MAIKRESGGKKTKPKKVMVDPSSSIPKMREAQVRASARYKAINNSNNDSDYALSRAADTYAKELRKIGIPVDVTKWMDYVPSSSSRGGGISNMPKRSLSTSKSKATNKKYTKIESNRLSKSTTKPKAMPKATAKPKAPRGR
jgi:hypothetical protein